MTFIHTQYTTVLHSNLVLARIMYQFHMQAFVQSQPPLGLQQTTTQTPTAASTQLSTSSPQAVMPAAAIQVPAVTPSAAASAAMTPDGVQDLARQVTEQQPALAAAMTSSPDAQSELVASQAVSLASARQAMQLMLQLLESGWTTAEQEADLRPASAVGPSEQVALQNLFRQLTTQISQPAAGASAADGPGLAASQADVLTAQAAELASARQAMQLMAQLLELEADGAGMHTTSVLPASHGDGPAPQQQPSALEVLHQVLAVLQPTAGPTMPASQLVHTPDQVCHPQSSSMLASVCLKRLSSLHSTREPVNID